MYTNASGLGTKCANHAHRLPFIKGIAKAMKGIGKVLVVLRYRSIPQCWFEHKADHRLAPSARSVEEIDENLYAIRPAVIGNLMLATYLSPLRLNIRRQVANELKHAFTSLNMSKGGVSWMTHPHHYLYRGCAGESHIVYECYDDMIFDSAGKGNRRTEMLELELARNAAINIATSNKLYEKLVPVNKNTKLVSNGAMYDLFSECRNQNMDVAPELKALKRPIIGIMGTLRLGYDYELLREMIYERPFWSFVFVGKISSSVKKKVVRLMKYPNFHEFSWRPHKDVPKFLKGFDVAIVPFEVNDWTRSINQNRTYDYFAAGIPVVATPTDEICRLERCVTICQNKDEFVHTIETIMQDGAAEKVKNGINLAKSMSWDAITRGVISELMSLR